MTELAPTPSQTVGPYLHIALPWADGPYLVAEATPGAIKVVGHLTDGEGQPVPDGLIEVWQADRDGRFNHPDDPRGAISSPGFRGFGRCETDAHGHFWFHTVKPGPLPAGNGQSEAPHIDVSVFCRGLLNRLVTRLYFPDEELANGADPVLCSLSVEDRSMLVAHPQPGGSLRLDIRLQGDGEMPFFTV